MAHPGGRPTKYNKEMLDKANYYLNNYVEYGDAVPTTAGLSIVLDVVKSTLYEWAKEHEEFSNTLDKIQQKQENILINKGLEGDFQATITKLMLANHGYHEKQEMELSNNKNNPLTFTVINADTDK